MKRRGRRFPDADRAWGGGVSPAQIARSAIPPQIGVWPAAVSGGLCTLVDIYAKRRMLSGPWSASRRLEAARIRGNEDEAKRMKAMLGDLVDEALEVEGTGQGDGPEAGGNLLQTPWTFNQPRKSSPPD